MIVKGESEIFFMMTVGDRLRMLRGGLSQAKFAAQIGVSSRSLYRYETDEAMPTDVFAKVCDLTGARADWLLFGTGPMKRIDEPAEADRVANGPGIRYLKADDQVEVPILAEVPAGRPLASTDQEAPTGIGMEGYVLVPDPKDENAFALKVRGDSMAPVLMPGDIIVVSPRRKEDLRYPIAVVKLRGEDVAVKYLKLRPPLAVLESANAAYPPVEVPLAEIEIVGRVCGWQRAIRE